MKAETLEFGRARDFLLSHREDYNGAVAGFRWPDFEQFNWALDWFDVIAAGNPRPALWIKGPDGEAKLSFEEMRQRSNQAANFLRKHGFGRGDRILLILGNVPPLWEIMLAAMKIGAVVIPGSTLLSREEIADRLVRGRVRGVIVEEEQLPKFEEFGGDLIRIAVGNPAGGWTPYKDASAESADFVPVGTTFANDPLLLYFTSGTTSKPKLVLHSHRSYPVGGLSTMYWIGLKPGDIHLNISSPGWAKHAWSCLFAPWNAEATVFMFNQPRFRAGPLLDALVESKVTTICAPPTVWRMLIQEDLSAWKVSLREAVGAGEPLNAEVIEQVRAGWGITIRDGYGQTETTAQIANCPGENVTPGCMGRPLPGYEVKLLDPDDVEADEGEIALVLGSKRPAGLMLGYDEDGKIRRPEGEYYRTGDIAQRDSTGLIAYVGRADDVFKASDYRISPFELESVLIEHPAIAEAAVVPSPDPLRLAVPKAFIVLAAHAIADEETALSILRHARESLSPFKRIRRIEFAELPKTISGKIRRVDLRKMEAARDLEVRRVQEWWEEDVPQLGG